MANLIVRHAQKIVGVLSCFDRLVLQILAGRGDRPGLVHIFSAMEPCPTYEPWHDKKRGCTFICRDRGKCLLLLLLHRRDARALLSGGSDVVSVSRAVYLNGHNWLASKLRSANISYELQDNAFAAIDDWEKARHLSDRLMIKQLHTRLDAAVARYLPDPESLGRYHWSILQAEYASDIVFRSAADLAPLYDHLSRTAIHAVKVDDVATFSAVPPTASVIARPAATFPFVITVCASREGASAITLDQPPSRCTTSTASFFASRLRRTMSLSFDTTAWWNSATVSGHEARCPSEIDLFAFSRPGLHLPRSQQPLYRLSLSSIDDPTPGLKALSKLSVPVQECDHRYHGFNFFDDDDQTLFEVLCRGEFFIHGFRNRSLRHHLKQLRASQISRLLKRLRLHGIIKKVAIPTSTISPNSDATWSSPASPSRTCSSFLSLRPPPSPTDLQILAFLQSIVRRTD